MGKSLSRMQNSWKEWTRLIGTFIAILGVFFAAQYAFVYQPLSSKVDSLDITLRGGEDTKGVLQILENLETRLAALEKIYETVTAPASSEGGEIPFWVFNPSEQLFWNITIQAPAGWVSEDTQLIASTFSFPESGLVLPEGYRSTNWSFVLSTPIGFSQPFSIVIGLTEEDLKLAGQADLLIILQWSSQERRWIELETSYIPETNAIRAIFAQLESPGYLVLAVTK